MGRAAQLVGLLVGRLVGWLVGWLPTWGGCLTALHCCPSNREDGSRRWGGVLRARMGCTDRASPAARRRCLHPIRLVSACLSACLPTRPPAACLPVCLGAHSSAPFHALSGRVSCHIQPPSIYSRAMCRSRFRKAWSFFWFSPPILVIIISIITLL